MKFRFGGKKLVIYRKWSIINKNITLPCSVEQQPGEVFMLQVLGVQAGIG